MMNEQFDSRWGCPDCGSRDVEVAYPAWYREGKDLALKPTSVDSEAEPLYWACNNCFNSGRGEPVNLLKD